MRFTPARWLPPDGGVLIYICAKSDTKAECADGDQVHRRIGARMPIEKQLQLLIPLIYDTSSSRDALPELLKALQRLFRARGCGLAIFNFQHREGILDESSGYSPDFLISYRDHYSRHDPWLRQEELYRVPGTVHVGRELVPDAELVGTQFYREWLQPQGLFHRMSAVLLRDGASLCYFATLRGRKDSLFG